MGERASLVHCRSFAVAVEIQVVYTECLLESWCTKPYSPPAIQDYAIHTCRHLSEYHVFQLFVLHASCMLRQRSRKVEVRPSFSAQSCSGGCQSYLKMTCPPRRRPTSSSRPVQALGLHLSASRSQSSGSKTPRAMSAGGRSQVASSAYQRCHLISGLTARR